MNLLNFSSVFVIFLISKGLTAIDFKIPSMIYNKNDMNWTGLLNLLEMNNLTNSDVREKFINVMKKYSPARIPDLNNLNRILDEKLGTTTPAVEELSLPQMLNDNRNSPDYLSPDYSDSYSEYPGEPFDTPPVVRDPTENSDLSTSQPIILPGVSTTVEPGDDGQQQSDNAGRSTGTKGNPKTTSSKNNNNKTGNNSEIRDDMVEIIWLDPMVSNYY